MWQVFRRTAGAPFTPVRGAQVALAMLPPLVGIAYPHWAAIVVLLSVQPDQMAALRLAAQRVVGAVLAAGLADVVLHVIPDPVVLAGLAVGGKFLSITV